MHVEEGDQNGILTRVLWRSPFDHGRGYAYGQSIVFTLFHTARQWGGGGGGSGSNGHVTEPYEMSMA